MGAVVLLAVEVAFGALLVVTYLRLRRRLGMVSASASGPPDQVRGEPLRRTGVVRAGRLSAMFVLVEIDRDAMWVRSRPRFLRLGFAVSRQDVAALTLEATGRGRLPNLVFEPAPGRAEGLGQLRFQLRGDQRALTGDLRRLGWPLPPTGGASAARSGATHGVGG